MHLTRFSICTAIATLAFLDVFVMNAAARPAAAATTPCGTITGPPAKIPAGTTRTYVIEVVRVPCAFAKTWAAKILRERTPSGGIFPHPKGPSGWQCSATTLVKHVAVDGFCGIHGSIRSFFWSPKGSDG
jgi:hypothetical protein